MGVASFLGSDTIGGSGFWWQCYNKGGAANGGNATERVNFLIFNVIVCFVNALGDLCNSIKHPLSNKWVLINKMQ